MDDRGQLYTLEGITGGLVIILGLFFALQATTATPGAAGSLSPHAEQQDRETVQGVLNAMNESTLRQATLYWDDDEERFHEVGPEGFYTVGTFSTGNCDIDDSGGPNPSNQFGRILCEQLGARYNYNVKITYSDTDDTLGHQRMIFQGQSGTGAVKGTTSVVLTNDQQLYEADDPIGSPEGESLADIASSSRFYAPPSDGDASDSNIYNVLHVEVVVWR